MATLRRLVTRCYDLDPRALLGPPGVLRMFEHLRWESATDAVVPWRALMGDGNFFVVRAQRLDLLDTAVGLGAELELRTWLGRVGRSSCDVCGVALLAATGAVVARSTVTAVYCGPNGRPRPMPVAGAGWIEAGEGASAPPWPGAAPPGAFRDPVVVRRSDTDLLHHVNHARWADYVDDARHACAAAGGYGPASARAAQAATHLSLDYAREAVLGDRLDVRTWALGETGPFAFELVRGSPAVVVARAVVATS